MATTIVQVRTGLAANGSAVTESATLAATSAGNFLIAFVSDNGNMTGLTFTNTNGDSFTTGGTNGQVKWGYCLNCTSGNTTVTANWTGGYASGIVVVEFSGIKTSAATDGFNNQTQGGGANTTFSSLTITTTGTDLIIGGVSNVSSNTTTNTSTSGLTIVSDGVRNGDLQIAAETQRLTVYAALDQAAGTYSNAGTFSAGSSYGANVAAFGVAASGDTLMGGILL
jgi:hypothetical protein